MQIRKLANTLLVSVICFFSIALMSFTGNGRTKTGGPRKDSSNASKSFDDVLNSLPGTPTDGNLVAAAPLNPGIVSFVKSFLSREGDDYNSMKNWGKSYFSLFDRVLSKYNLPCQLKYLAVIESSLQPSMVSSAGAVGPWQIMPDEAREYGLHVGGKHDERKDVAKSTTVAAKLLSKLYDHLGDWLLVIAAYNAGEGRVRQAIKKAGSSSFWAIQNFLPAETRNHVKKFIATHYYFEGCGGVTTMTSAELKDYMPLGIPKINIDDWDNTKIVEIKGRYSSTIMAKYLQMDEGLLRHFNPGLKDALNSGTAYKLRLPINKAELFQESKTAILEESVENLLSNTETAKN